MPTAPDLISKVQNLPALPGVYRYLNKNGKIIYIGKAKDLRKRVGSYFAKSRKHSYRIERLVQSIADIAYTVVNSEVEALLLENNLIKTHQPRYNILLKDGKTYPYICVKNERFPRVFSTRQRLDDGSLYFGPYANLGVMKDILALIRGFVKLRNCTYHLSESNIQAGKFKRCLEFQIGNCAGPCEGIYSEEAYMTGIEQVKYVLRGNLAAVTERLESLMNQAAAEYQFEQAEFYRKRIEQVKAYKRKSTVVSEKIRNLEVLTVLSEQQLAVVTHFKVENGAIIQTHSWETKVAHQEEEDEIIQTALEQLMLTPETTLAEEIVVNIAPQKKLIEGVNIFVPQKGDKRHLVDLGLKNCRTLLTEKLYKQNFQKRRQPGEIMVEALQAALNMESPPNHIECFDNSNFQGTDPVASMVVFRNGKPAKRDYRHFHIKTVEGPNDFASMTEVVGRRYKRLLEEKKELPDLVVIDGGKGQLSSAAEALRELGVLDQIPLIGIAKRLEEIYAVGDPIPLHIDKTNPALHLIQQLRNEAHRFAITFHRNLRSKKQRSKLTGIKGIGEQTEQFILREFRSVKKLKEADPRELEAKLGKSKARIILNAIAEGKI